MERTLVLIKPDGVQRKMVGKIISRLEDKGLTLLGIKMLTLNDRLLAEHYSHLKDRPFFPEICSFMKSAPVVAMCWKGLKCVDAVRKICGVTNSREAEPGSIRGDYAMSVQANLVHASDTVEAADVEIARFFGVGELQEYSMPNEPFVYSASERS